MVTEQLEFTERIFCNNIHPKVVPADILKLWVILLSFQQNWHRMKQNQAEVLLTDIHVTGHYDIYVTSVHFYLSNPFMPHDKWIPWSIFKFQKQNSWKYNEWS